MISYWRNEHVREAIGILIVIGVTIGFVWQIWWKDFVPLPADLLVGAYYPWLEYKWGYAVGVPVKNPLLSDAWSQFYIWKQLIADAYVHGEWPLWNPYSLGGYPLAGTFHSGAFYPLNWLLVWFGTVKGWSWMIGIQFPLMGVTMYSWLRTLRIRRWGAIAGALVYALSGFSVSWSEMATAGQAMIWLPLLLLFFELGLQKSWLWWWVLACPWWLILMAGHFQTVVYTAVLLAAYMIYRIWVLPGRLQLHAIFWVGGGMLMGTLMAGMQIGPTWELGSRSIRFIEGYIADYNYGLSPLGKLITLWAPDFYGNPARGNYWGFWNYHETVLYVGIPGLCAVLTAMYRWKRLGQTKFFLVLAIICLLLMLDTPLGRAIYWWKVPGLGTSAAGRVGVIWSLAVAVLTAEWTQWLMSKEARGRTVVKIGLFSIGMLGLIGLISLGSKVYFAQEPRWWPLPELMMDMQVGMRNLFVPVVLMLGMIMVVCFRRWRWWPLLLLMLLTADLYRFGWRYLPVVSPHLVFPQTAATDFLQENLGYYRVDRERGELLPPNTWAAYGLASPSGYDPMAVREYVEEYQRMLNGNQSPHASRYAELERLDPESLGAFGVKYVLALKRDEVGKIPGDRLSYLIDETQWKRAWESEAVAILENPRVQERTFIVGDDGRKSGIAEIVAYRPQEVKITYRSDTAGNLVLTDSWFPGWKVWVNGVESVGSMHEPIFRQVAVPPGSGEVVWKYVPDSFKLGLYVSLCASVVWLGVLLLQLAHQLFIRPFSLDTKEHMEKA